MKRVAMMAALALAAGVIGSMGLLLPSEKAVMQDDIVVKPGGGGKAAGTKAESTRTLDWRLRKTNREMDVENAMVLRDDVQGLIAEHGFELRTVGAGPFKASRIEFTVMDQNQPVTVTIRRVGSDRFHWSFNPHREIGKCKAHYDDPNDPNCVNDGIPGFFKGALVGNIKGEYTTTDADGKPVTHEADDVKEFNLFGGGKASP